MPELYPLLFEPILKPKVWGGRRLEHLGRSLPPGVAIGESWEVSDLPGDSSVVANGELAGRTLRQLVETMAGPLLGEAKPSSEGGFPLLIKYLDARENLSVQVHPDPAYAAAHPDAHLKSEAWYVIDADPGAVIYKGLAAGVTAEHFARHIREDKVVADLQAVPVVPGDCHYLPSGTCHALGGGVLVAEVQTPSDTTFRVYDWGRTDRELHVEQAMTCIRFGEFSDPAPARSTPIVRDGISTIPLVGTGYFAIERIEVEAGGSFPVVTNGLPEVWLFIEGSGKIESGPVVDVSHGDTVLLPAETDDATARFAGPSTVLRVTLPSPLTDQIAEA